MNDLQAHLAYTTLLQYIDTSAAVTLLAFTRDIWRNTPEAPAASCGGCCTFVAFKLSRAIPNEEKKTIRHLFEVNRFFFCHDSRHDVF